MYILVEIFLFTVLLLIVSMASDGDKFLGFMAFIVFLSMIVCIVLHSIDIENNYTRYEVSVLAEISDSYELTDKEKYDIRSTFEENRKIIPFGYSSNKFIFVFIDSEKYLLERETGYLYFCNQEPFFDDEGKHIIYEHFDKIINYLDKEW